MKPVSSIFSADRGRGMMAVIFAILLAALAVFATMALTGDGRSPAEADSLAAPLSHVPQDPPTSGSVFVKINVGGEDIEGESVYGERFESFDPQGWTDVLEYNHSIVSPRDAASGLPTGKRTHSAIVITKRIDKSSPQLLRALAENQTVSMVVEFERSSTDGDGTIEVYYKVETGGGRITGIRKHAGLFGGDTETISISYATIEEENLSNGASVDIDVQSGSSS